MTISSNLSLPSCGAGGGTCACRSQGLAALQALKSIWKNVPPNWAGADPCGDGWDGIKCINNRVVTITLASINLSGQLSSDIAKLSELQTLDLSYNKDMIGPLPAAIGDVRKLASLILVGCGFSGPIPPSIGSLQRLRYLSLNSNNFIGEIPPSIGNLANLYWLDLADNRLSGTIPVSNGSSPGLDMLVNTKHFHFGKNQLSGEIPPRLFNSNLTLIHLLLENNQLTGRIPSTVGLVRTLEVVRLDRNSLSGSVPQSLNNLTTVQELDMSNNSFDATDIPPWFSSLQSLTSLIMENTQIQGQLPVSLFSLFQLQTVLVGNPICNEGGNQNYCSIPQQSNSSYSTPAENCLPVSCSSDKISSPSCKCAYPYTGTLFFRAPSFSSFVNSSIFASLQQKLMVTFRSNSLPVDSVSLSQTVGSHKSSNTSVIIGAAVGGTALFLLLLLAGVYAFCQKRRAESAAKRVILLLQPSLFILAASWDPNTNSGGVPQLKGAKCFSFEELKRSTSNFSETNEIGTGGYGKVRISSSFVTRAVVSGFSFSFVLNHILSNISSLLHHASYMLHLLDMKLFPVYRGTLPNGQLVAIKRAQQGSMQGGLEFKTEIELLSRVHHKNVVSLVGFCFEQGEQLLVYEYIANGTLKDSLSGRTGIRLDWMRRLRIALGAARGLQYLHDLANPPIIHRDIKSNNILLDERLNAKVADFGLSKPMGDSERGHVTTQVKGTMGYLDPEYYMTQQLTEKSDVYSFGVLLLELLTARSPIEKGKYIVREVKQVMDTTKDMYNLQSILDPIVASSMSSRSVEIFVDLSLRCVQELGANRPTMSEVVKEIENIMEMAGLNPNAESASTSASYEGVSKGFDHPYSNEGLFAYSGAYPPSKLEPK
ncbi:hypothetical protein DH2020_047184 [Rehmannia glutinosa]|uniref:Protein kinase domain-containing protein n=1 Tax=Rehmannia glutinosa TaxID=99300 RepID=A0ABR0UAS3_REHGL